MVQREFKIQLCCGDQVTLAISHLVDAGLYEEHDYIIREGDCLLVFDEEKTHKIAKDVLVEYYILDEVTQECPELCTH